MANTKDIDGSANPRAFFASELRRCRIAAGFKHTEDLGKLLFCSGNYISKLERTVKLPNKDFAERLDAALGTEGHFQRLLDLAVKSTDHPQFFAQYAELEQTATKIEEFAPTLFPGLLQTPDYAREAFRAVWAYLPAEAIEEKVEKRLKRADLLKSDVKLWYVLAEHVIQGPGIADDIMAPQLQHVVELIESRRIVVQVLPADVGLHALSVGPLSVLHFADSPPVAYTEGPHSGQLMDSPEEIENCQLSYDQVRALALAPGASLALIKSALEDRLREE